jgi:hypothetical protein
MASYKFKVGDNVVINPALSRFVPGVFEVTKRTACEQKARVTRPARPVLLNAKAGPRARSDRLARAR